MTADELTSAVNTINGWRARRLAKGKSADATATEAHIRATWSDLSDADVAAIMTKGNF